MSFSDLERGERGFVHSPRLGSDNPTRDNPTRESNNNNVGRASGAAFSARVNQLSQRVFCISSNVANLQRLVGLLGTSKDTEALRGNLHDVTEDTRTLVRESSQDIRNLARLDNTHAKKLEHNKISKDFQKVLVEFQKVQRLSAEKQREFVDRVKHTSFGKAQDLPSVQDEPSQSSAQLSQWDSQRRMQLLMVDNELDFNEAMIGQREQEIQEIEHGITEINEVFKDLGSMVYEQSSLLDSIEYNVTPIAMNTRAAAEELTTAALRQRNARKRSCCILILVAVVTAVVVIAILA